ncbi:MAG: hypothetical protein WCK35_23875 [Chloroflexota bacterium]
MNPDLLEIHDYKGPGYQPLIDYSTWRVAILRFIDEIIPDRIDFLERHNETDEVFVLLEGRAILFIGEGDPELKQITPLRMEPGKLYNIKKHTWHSVVLTPDASILLVENCDTGRDNSDYATLSQEFRLLITQTSALELPDFWGIELKS